MKTQIITSAIIAALLALSACEGEQQLVSKNVKDFAPKDSNSISFTIPNDTLAGDTTAEYNLSFISRYKDDLGKRIQLKIQGAGVFTNGKDSLSAQITSNGIAKFNIKPVRAGKALITVAIGGRTLQTEILFLKPGTVEKYKLMGIRTQNIPADNYAYAEVAIVISNPESSSKQYIFTCDKGVFSNNTNTYMVTSGAADTIRAFIKHNQAEMVRIYVNVNSKFIGEIYVNFTTAFPEILSVNPDSPIIGKTPGEKKIITVKLMRKFGIPTLGQSVLFSDSTSTGNSAGMFSSIETSNGAGQINAQYFVTDTAYRGPIYLKCTAQGANGKIVGYSKLVRP